MDFCLAKWSLNFRENKDYSVSLTEVDNDIASNLQQDFRMLSSSKTAAHKA